MRKKQKSTSPVPTAPPNPPSTSRYILGNLFNLLRRFGGTTIVWACIAFLGYEAKEVLIAYAGRSSFADLTFRLLAQVSIVWKLSLTLAGFSITLYLRERNLHRKTRERLTARITQLELKIDPTRTSSLLTPEGLTREEDQ
jgi:hypothetical protein